MYPFIESIRLANGQMPLLPYHQERMERTRRAFYNNAPPVNLHKLLQPYAGARPGGVYKCRVVYTREVLQVEVAPYTFKPIQSLLPVQAGKLDYAWKYANREGIGQLWKQRGSCDDILMVRNGYVTDTSYCNVAFLSPSGVWLTPEAPLLPGTRRQYLLDRGMLQQAPIALEDVNSFLGVRLFNAMILWEEAPEPIIREPSRFSG